MLSRGKNENEKKIADSDKYLNLQRDHAYLGAR